MQVRTATAGTEGGLNGSGDGHGIPLTLIKDSEPAISGPRTVRRATKLLVVWSKARMRPPDGARRSRRNDAAALHGADVWLWTLCPPPRLHRGTHKIVQTHNSQQPHQTRRQAARNSTTLARPPAFPLEPRYTERLAAASSAPETACVFDIPGSLLTDQSTKPANHSTHHLPHTPPRHPAKQPIGGPKCDVGAPTPHRTSTGLEERDSLPPAFPSSQPQPRSLIAVPSASHSCRYRSILWANTPSSPGD